MALKPHGKLTSTLCILLKLTIVVQVVAVLAGVYDFYSYSNLPLDVDLSEIMLPSDILILILALVQIVLGIVVAFTFLRWIYISNKNLRAVSGGFITYTPGWSVGWFFVPFANVWKPYQVVKEIWVASHDGDAVDQDVVGWWWSLFLLSGILNRLTFRMSMRAEDVVSYNNATLMQIAADGTAIVLGVLALTMVTRIGAAYSENFVKPTSLLSVDGMQTDGDNG